MPHLLEKLGLSEAGMRLMVARLSRIHKAMTNLILKEIQKERDKAS